MSRPAGPLTGAPPMIGLTPTTEAFVARRASAMPGTARIGPIEVTGFDGQITMGLVSAIDATTSGAGRASAAPSYATDTTSPWALSRTKYSWKLRRPAVVVTLVRTGASLIGRRRALTPRPAPRRAVTALSVS